ncbi:hypothetical protein XELAEV_18038450mg [Xenopus laevis]|uniref:Uncharacterized protein n=1 Tax=Xenopus laevis TaxID=8355 RepID=A0A974C688_XENLA|nr:hypothetical protein XELAEV_18038450mg [Xenopus laevis]
MATLHRSTQAGGLAVPNLYLYYLAALLVTIRWWFESDCTNASCTLESGILGSREALRLLPYRGRAAHPQLAQKLLTPTGLTYHSPHAPLWCNKLLPHFLTNQDYKFWAGNGLRYVRDLYHEGELKSFLELKASCPTQHVTQFRYDQLRHGAQAQFPNPQSTIVATSLENALQLQVVGKPLSAIYHSLLAPEEKRPLKCFQKWIRDIDNLDEESWELIMRHMLATTISARDKLVQLKFMQLTFDRAPHPNDLNFSSSLIQGE